MPTKNVAKNVLPVFLTLCLITFTAGAQRGGGHGGGGGGHASGGGGGHVSAGGGGHVASAPPSVRSSSGYSTQGYRGGVAARGGIVSRGRPVVSPRGYYGYNNGYRGYGRYGYGLGYYGGYYPGYYYGCPYDPSCYAPASYGSYEYPQPVAVEPGPDYSQQYAAPPPPQGYYAPPPQPPTPTALTLLAFKDHSIQVAMAYSFDRGSVVYVNETGVRKSVPADQLDFDTTRKLNTDRGVTFDPR